MDSVRSTHARVAALARHRGQNDPEVNAARAALNRQRDAKRARLALSLLEPEDRAEILSEGEATSV